MSIKINNKALQKAQINGKEVQKIVINGNTVYQLETGVINNYLGMICGPNASAASTSYALKKQSYNSDTTTLSSIPYGICIAAKNFNSLAGQSYLNISGISNASNVTKVENGIYSFDSLNSRNATVTLSSSTNGCAMILAFEYAISPQLVYSANGSPSSSAYSLNKKGTYLVYLFGRSAISSSGGGKASVQLSQTGATIKKQFYYYPTNNDSYNYYRSMDKYLTDYFSSITSQACPILYCAVIDVDSAASLTFTVSNTSSTWDRFAIYKLS